jgi:threonine/homoserine/homoserine lactone efflux protein
MRVTPERLLFRVLTIAFLVLLVAGAAALVWDAWRLRPRLRPRARRAGGSASPRLVPLTSQPATGEVVLADR